MDPATHTSGDSPAVRAAILDLIAADKLAGSVRSVEIYRRRFPGYEQCVDSVYDSIVHGDDVVVRSHPLTIGGLRVIRELGRGGQAAVYLAEDEELGRQVAVKILSAIHAVDADRQERFRREAALVARLDDPGISKLYRVGVEDDRPFFVMEYIAGPSLAELSEAGSVLKTQGLSTILDWMQQLARSLHGAHCAGVIHRDIKPANIIVNEQGRPVLLDFGLARGVDEQWTQLTLTGAELGTPAYMSPEQVDSSQPVDLRTDIYSLGVTLYEVLTGTRPFQAPSREELTAKIRHGNYLPLKTVLPQLGRDVRAVVAKAMDRSPNRRYRSAAEFADDLQRCLNHEPVRARPLPLPVRCARFLTDHPVASTVMLTLGLGLGVSLVSLRTAWEQRQLAAARLAENHQLTANSKIRELLDTSDPDLYRVHPDTEEVKVAWLKSADLISREAESFRSALLELRAQGRQVTHKTPGDREKEALLARLDAEIAARTAGDPQIPMLEQRRRAVAAGLQVEPAWEFDDLQLQWRHDILAPLVKTLHALDEATPGAMSRAIVSRQLDRCRQVRAATIDAHRGAWDQVLRGLGQDSRYAGLNLQPVCGLIPLGRDESTGLWEFCVWGTGETPARESAGGRLESPQTEHGLVLVLLPGGVFDAGKVSRHGENYHRRVSLRPFFVGKYEVTQAQWLRVMGINPSMFHPDYRWRASYRGPKLTLLHPVDSVTFRHGLEFAQRVDCGLPSEAQWEYACLGGGGGSGEFAWAARPGENAEDALRERENVCGQEVKLGESSTPPASWTDDYPVTAPVGAFAANGFGLFDMHGNVTEWTCDSLVPAPMGYRGPILAGQKVPGDGRVLSLARGKRVHKGGCWFLGPSIAGARNNFWQLNDATNPTIGVRVVKAWPRE